jgi:hypothetical protein
MFTIPLSNQNKHKAPNSHMAGPRAPSCSINGSSMKLHYYINFQNDKWYESLKLANTSS